MRDRLREVVALTADHTDEVTALETRCQTAALVAEQALQQLEVSDSAVTVQAERSREKLLRRWDSDRDAARAAARSIADRRRSADLEEVVDLCGGEGCHCGSGDAEAELVGAVKAVLAQLAGLCLGQR